MIGSTNMDGVLALYHFNCKTAGKFYEIKFFKLNLEILHCKKAEAVYLNIWPEEYFAQNHFMGSLLGQTFVLYMQIV